MRREQAWRLAERYGTRFVDRDDGTRVAYLRPAPRRTSTPVVFLPGGPGIGSVFLYRALRSQAVARGLDVLMMEHRGVGFSRLRADGTEPPIADVTVEAAADDLAAVLDAEGIERAIVYGTSYGSYLAQLFGVRHPGRVAGMVLDSPVLSAGDRRTVRAYRRELLLHGTGRLPTLVRGAVAAADEDGNGHDVNTVGHVVQVVYEFAGPQALERLLAARRRGRGERTWRWLASLGASEREGRASPFVAEFDLVAGITHGVLGLGADADGLPLDPQQAFAAAAAHPESPAFTGDTVDLPAALPKFAWPAAVVSGAHDLRTPPAVAERAAALLPDAALVRLPETGHSAMDTHRLAALHIAHHVERGDLRGLTERADRIATLPRRGMSGALGPLIRTAVRLIT